MESYFIINVISKSVDNQFQDLPGYYEQLTPLEQQAFQNALGKSMKITVPLALAKKHIPIMDIEDIKKQPLWLVIKKMGIDKQVENTVREMKDREIPKLTVRT